MRNHVCHIPASLENRLVRMQQRLRAGATLTEVLIALLIMSIGLVSLAVLFPISVLRSIKAAQFTTATDARYNAEAMIDVFPRLVRDPGLFATPGTVGTPPIYWGTNFIVDPLGFAEAANNPNTANFAPFFGNDTSFPNPPNAMPWTLMTRFRGMWNTEAAADNLVTMPDSWELQYNGVVVPGTQSPGIGSTQINVKGLGATGFTLAPPSAPGLSGSLARIVLFSADGRVSHARNITSVVPIAGGDATVIWTEDTNGTGTYTAAKDLNGNGILDAYPLPASFVPGGRARIEMQVRRYSWLLTVRVNEGGSASVDVVVFFQRRFDVLTDEALYPAIFQAGTNQVSVTYTAGSPPPFMHKGNYIFDANNAYWYRVGQVNDNGNGQAVITLDVPANASNNAAIVPRAMFPRNIVEVYSLGPK